jgi:hypothetical protein
MPTRTGWLASCTQKNNPIVHLGLMAGSVGLLAVLWFIWPSPVTPAANWRPASTDYPVLSIFFILALSVGLPFFVLSTNSPLMQAWFNRANPGRSPYWLYALSNIGSLLSLIIYPTVIEPALTLQWQGWAWSGSYLLFVLLAGRNALINLRGSQTAPSPALEVPQPDKQKTPAATYALWILLSACASLLLLAITSQITQEVAAIPFLWVLPLSIYLLSFVLAFSSKRWYQRKPFGLLLLLTTGGWVYITIVPYANLILQIAIYNLLLFAATMICHGELYALRPQASALTQFYLLNSIGGAAGALFVNLAAPFIFPVFWEHYFGIACVWILLAVLSFQPTGPRAEARFGLFTGASALAVTIFAVFLLLITASGSLFVRRNFYGVVHVNRTLLGAQQSLANKLVHGSTAHGFQYLDANLLRVPTSYYGKDSGVGLAILNNPRYGAGLRVGVLGLGVGTLAAYGQPQDSYRFYEINPVVIDLANGQDGLFSFVKDSPAHIQIIEGDARLSLEKELAAQQANNFNILVLDTFSSDSIPVHLVSQQAFGIYLQNLAPDGLLAANISNIRLDLRPVLFQLAQAYHLQMAVIEHESDKNDPSNFPSTWVLLTRNPGLLAAPAIANQNAGLTGFRTDTRLWTDDYSNLFQILK